MQPAGKAYTMLQIAVPLFIRRVTVSENVVCLAFSLLLGPFGDWGPGLLNP